MSDESTPRGGASGSTSLGDILVVAEGIRTDVRAMETRVSADIGELRDDFEGFVGGHAKHHTDRDTWQEEKLGELVSRLNAYDLHRARQEGAWGMVRWSIDLLGRNWKLLATAAFAALTLLGNIRISFLS